MKIPLHLEFPRGRKAPSRQPQALVPPANIPVTPSVASPQKSFRGGQRDGSEGRAVLSLQPFSHLLWRPGVSRMAPPSRVFASAQPSPPRGWLSWKGPPGTGFSEMPCPNPAVVRGGLRFLLANFSLVQDGLPPSLMVKNPKQPSPCSQVSAPCAPSWGFLRGSAPVLCPHSSAPQKHPQATRSHAASL